MLSLHVRRRIKGLLLAGLTQVEVAEATGVSLRSVKRIAKEPGSDSVSDVEERRRRGIGRPSKVAPFGGYIARLITADPQVSSAEILRRLQMAGYSGGRSALYALAAELRTTSNRVDRVVLEGTDDLASGLQSPYREQTAR